MAALLALTEASAYVAAFVGSVYAFPSTRTADEAKRDSPGVVARRCFSILALSGGCVWLTAMRRGVPCGRVLEAMLVGEMNAVAMTGTLTGPQHTAALVSETAAAAWRGVSVTAVLFAGVIANHAIDAARNICAIARERTQQPSPSVVSVASKLPLAALQHVVVTPLQQYAEKPALLAPDLRNYLFAPIAEEVVLRYMLIDAMERAVLAASGGYAPGCVLTRLHRAAFTTTEAAALARAGTLPDPTADFHLIANPRRRMFWSAVLFASSHLHHIVRYRNTRLESARKRMPLEQAKAYAWKAACQMAAGHMVVTATFGMLSSWILLRRADGSIVAPLASHALCNYLGAPSLAYWSEDRRSLVPDVSNAPKIVPAWVVAAERALITAAHVAGIVGFVAIAGGWWK